MIIQHLPPQQQHKYPSINSHRAIPQPHNPNNRLSRYSNSFASAPWSLHQSTFFLHNFSCILNILNLHNLQWIWHVKMHRLSWFRFSITQTNQNGNQLLPPFNFFSSLGPTINWTQPYAQKTQPLQTWSRFRFCTTLNSEGVYMACASSWTTNSLTT